MSRMGKFCGMAVCWALLACCLGCQKSPSGPSAAAAYDFAQPDRALVLPDSLHEVSGVATIDSVTLACVQDENGIIFIYDLARGEIKHKYIFNFDGDYEGVTVVGQTIYVLRSDGTLFEVADYASKNFRLTEHATGIPAHDNEGLCHDPANGRLLIASKGRIGKGRAFKDKRVIYGFDLKTKALSARPAFDFDLYAIKQFALREHIELVTKKKGKGKGKPRMPTIKFKTSAICIHPKTQQLYLLSAAEHLLFIFSMDGTLQEIVALDPAVYNKAEGISFFGNGDMLITNEGQGGKPTLLMLKYKQR